MNEWKIKNEKIKIDVEEDEDEKASKPSHILQPITSLSSLSLLFSNNKVMKREGDMIINKSSSDESCIFDCEMKKVFFIIIVLLLLFTY